MHLHVQHWQQRQQGECLVACVAMLFAYIGRRVRYQRLLRQLDTSTAGTFFFNLDRLRSFWFIVERNQGNLTSLRQQLDDGHPIIVPVDTEVLPYWLARHDIAEEERITQHVVVVVGIDHQFVYVNDPDFAEAPQLVEIRWFMDAWQYHDGWYAVIRRRWR